LEEIKDLLLTSKVDIDWKETLKIFSEKADECNRLLHKIIFFKQCRDYEKNRNKSRMSYYALCKTWERVYFKEQNTFSGDIFYFPYKVRTDDEHKVFFDDKQALEYLKRLLNPEYKLKDSYILFINYTLTLKKAFYELAILAAQNINPPLELTIHLYMILETICDKSKELWSNLVDEERQRMTNSRNASTRTPARIEEYKKHDLYPQLDKIIRSYQETPKELRDINELVGKIIDTENRVTIRRYRYLFFQEIKKG